MPKIHGVIIPEGRTLDNFILLDQDQQKFTNEDLFGKWHLISYGYTSCPDICPMTLNKLSQLEKRLRQEDKYSDLNVVFYSVDPLRDTAQVLSQYVHFFNPNFIALSYKLDMGTNHIPFEKSLGIVSAIENLQEGESDYEVHHGIVLYLIDPRGQLRAVLQPQENKHGVRFFTVEQMYQDYIKLRRFWG